MKTYQFNNGASAVIDFEKCTFALRGKNGATLTKGETPFFAVKLRNKAGAHRIIYGNECSFIELKENTAQYMHEQFCAFVKVDQGADGLIFRLSVENKTTELLEWVELGSFGVDEKLREEEGGKGEIAYPFNEGCIVSNMQKREGYPFRYIEPEYPSLGKYSIFPNMISSQFLAYTTEEQSIYIGMHDQERTTKHIDFRYGENCIKLQMRVFCNVGYGESYAMPFDTVVKVFDGNYYDACEIYRTWFERSLPKGVKKLKDSNDLPAWYGESPIVIAYPVRGKFDTDEMTPNGLYPYVNALPFLRAIAEGTDSRVMSLMMHWEGTAPWAPPYVWPPYGGESALYEFIEQAHAENVLVGLYCSGLGWTQQSCLIGDYNKENEFKEKELSKIMCSDSDGSISSAICTAQRSGYDLCPACEESKSLIVDEITKIVQSGVDYVQALDQNHGGCSYFCYSEKHGHVPAPGKWQAEETLKLLDRIPNGKVLLGCESAAAEPLIGRLRFSDNRFELNYYNGTPVPMYSYIYHEYLNNFMGNQICMMLEKNAINYAYRVGYSFVAGDMLTAVIDDKGQISYCWGSECFKQHTDKKNALRILKNLNGWRQGVGKQHLHLGRMVKPLAVSAEGKNLFLLEDDLQLEVEKFHTAAYEFEGEFAQFIVNYNLEPLTVKMNEPVQVCTDYKQGGFTKKIKEFTIPALSAVMLKK